MFLETGGRCRNSDVCADVIHELMSRPLCCWHLENRSGSTWRESHVHLGHVDLGDDESYENKQVLCFSRQRLCFRAEDEPRRGQPHSERGRSGAGRRDGTRRRHGAQCRHNEDHLRRRTAQQRNKGRITKRHIHSTEVGARHGKEDDELG